MKTNSAERGRLVPLGEGSGRPLIGVHGAPARLPQLLRLQGDAAHAFTTRALRAVTGDGALWARPNVATLDGSHWRHLHADRSQREFASAGGHPIS